MAVNEYLNEMKSAKRRKPASALAREELRAGWRGQRDSTKRSTEDGMFVIPGMESRYFHRGSLEGIVQMNEKARVRSVF